MIDGQPVSLLISSRNRPTLLLAAIQSVLKGSALPDEMVVVDQSDNVNETVAALMPPAAMTFRYIRSATTGISRSRNIAFRAARHPLIVVIDDDCVVTRTWLEDIVRALLAAGPTAVVTGRVLAGEQHEEGAFAPSLHLADEPVTFAGRITTDPLATFNFALHAATYAAVGPFDTRIGPGTRFPSSEDNDYGYRLLLAGYTIVFEPGAVVHHQAWRTAANYVAVRYAYGRGQGGYYGKHLAGGDWYMLRKLAHALGRRARRMAAGDRLGVMGELAWIGGWVAGVATWLLRPGRLDDRVTRSPDGSRGW
ncbi:glycosyltransferase family 2 protein [Pseudonocardia sp. KRD-184]|uniref:Glycosyltransferase family 2 protein n=1 Tax=Pseudonocardia oceani TaxID=2792013 RepID=A0ABS6UJS2_9PSEU|nr:glycosyltransferase family 2 protein [Pseudonocardia oceani]MBW0088610.1 glycosyltransferase family 2 protein [Pseudonocardia oceani]MBW0095453.1 glycosyltransferase family 2 protein [Pseudonocardia oceani]MBW0109050.1 glycosyltransferase family 2 protein [Pseudonocardia oceani]MBW0120025.1 glycosyltransferase family 2 protein [Pseudonocardia oceani]MBW0132481.1 glycosyltransferase family 2 protein [Pseudonocardia oceani]